MPRRRGRQQLHAGGPIWIPGFPTRGILDPTARHVTAALESARVARSEISIRDWPDSDHQDQFLQKVQARWMAMVNEGSALRSKLEPLGGRSVRFISPGDGREDFPGGASPSSTARGPRWLRRPAERLSRLLVRRRETTTRSSPKRSTNCLEARHRASEGQVGRS